MASYLCYGSDFRKGEIVPPQARPPHDERYYAQRRVPDADELLRCLRNYVLLSATEVDGQFAAVGALLRWRFPNAAVPFACAERRNVSPSAQKSRVRTSLSAGTDALALNQLDTLLWRHVTATHPLAVE